LAAVQTASTLDILLVDDDRPLREMLTRSFEREGHRVTAVADGQAALDAAADRPYDVVLLDVALGAGPTGHDVARLLRGRRDVVPIIMLTALDSEADAVQGLEAGADDYVTKPFNIEELLARMRAVGRRLRPELVYDEPVAVGEYTVDLAEKAVRSADGALLHLTKTEWDLLAILVRNPGKLVSQRQLLQDVWGPTYLNETHYLRQYMAQLRKKLEPDPTRPRHLLTEPGMGYRFMP
jgi:DNA-binding response OmpR family regulator